VLAQLQQQVAASAAGEMLQADQQAVLEDLVAVDQQQLPTMLLVAPEQLVKVMTAVLAALTADQWLLTPVVVVVVLVQSGKEVSQDNAPAMVVSVTSMLLLPHSQDWEMSQPHPQH
jgi:hypothetical protein